MLTIPVRTYLYILYIYTENINTQTHKYCIWAHNLYIIITLGNSIITRVIISCPYVVHKMCCKMLQNTIKAKALITCIKPFLQFDSVLLDFPFLQTSDRSLFFWLVLITVQPRRMWRTIEKI